MCILDSKTRKNIAYLKKIKEYKNDWNYTNQEAWKKYQNYHSTLLTPFDIKTNFIIVPNKINKIEIHYQDNTLGTFCNHNDTPYFITENSDNYILYEDKKFVLINYHIHCSSEHSIDSQYFPVECHFVNSYTDPETEQIYYIVISLLVNISDSGLSIFNIDYKNISDDANEYEGVVNLQLFNDLDINKYFNFIGTLTTPPFTQNIHFNLFTPFNTTNIQLTINKNDFNNLIYFFDNNKANQQSLFSNTRYIKDEHNYAVVKLIV